MIGYLVWVLFYSGDPELPVGHLLMAVTPVAVTSVVWTGIAGGNVALSIALVTVATLVSATNYFGPVVSLPVIGCMIGRHFWAGVFFRIVGRPTVEARENPSSTPF